MGSGIAQVTATAGHGVDLIDADPAALDRARSAMAHSLERLAAKDRLDGATPDGVLDAVDFGTDAGAAARADLVIEAVSEDLALKHRVWRELGEVASAAALLATNTSSLSVTELAASVPGPERFVGLHFFNPVPVLPLVEVVRAERSADEAVEDARRWAETIGKTPIVCSDTPGFVVNRLLIPYLNDAVFALAEGVASAEEIDAAMRLGANMPMGPLALADLVGLDVTLAAAESLHGETGDPKFRVHPRLRRLVRAGKLGRKTGEGFHVYDDR